MLVLSYAYGCCKGEGNVILVPTIKEYWGVEVLLYSFLNLALIEVRVSFTPRPLYPQGKMACYPLCRMLGGPQSWPCHFGKDINLLFLLEIGT